MSDLHPVLDVRPDLAAGNEPFSKILKTAEDIAEGGSFTVIAPFEPVPLFGVLKQLGYSHDCRSRGADGFEVVFTRNLGGSGGAR